MSTTGRDETPAEKADRNWNDLLQELRVTQTGVQILFSLLLTVPFSQRFPTLTSFQEAVYLATLLTAAAAVLLLGAPAMYHRVLFGVGDKATVVRRGSVMSIAGATAGLVAVCGALLLIVDLVVGRTAAVSLAGAYLLGGLWLFFGMALLRRART